MGTPATFREKAGHSRPGGKGAGSSRSRNVTSKPCERRRGALARDGQEEGQGGRQNPGPQHGNCLGLGLQSDPGMEGAGEEE